MTTNELNRIKALLERWKQDVKERQDLGTLARDEYSKGYGAASVAIRQSDIAELGELLEDFSSSLTTDDIMGRLSKFLDREDFKVKVQEDRRRWNEEMHQRAVERDRAWHKQYSKP